MLYKAKYFSNLTLIALVLFFYLAFRVIKQDIFWSEFIVYLILFIIMICVELFGFSRALKLKEDSLQIFNGFQYIFYLKPSEIKYSEIIKLNEIKTPRKKFSNLKIITDKKIYMIPITGICDYEKMKKDLEIHILAQTVKLKIK